MFTKVFVALMAASAALAAPSKRQSFDYTTCEVVLTPSITPGAIDFTTEFNYLLGRTLAQQVSGTAVGGVTVSYTANLDGTYTVERTAAIDGKTAAEVATIFTSLVGVTNNGFANGAAIDWHYDSVSCA